MRNNSLQNDRLPFTHKAIIMHMSREPGNAKHSGIRDAD